MRTAIVSLDGVRVGTLTEDDDRLLVTFAYDEVYLATPGPRAISLRLLLSPDAVVTRGLHPFFSNLLPEGWLRALAIAKLGVDENDPFGLLIATGADCAGAVEITPDGTSEGEQ